MSMIFWKSAAERSEIEEIERRSRDPKDRVSFGVQFLDDCLRMVQPDDIILVGARSGAGKTQFCTNMAIANVMNGKRVHFIALEAFIGEIEARIRYSLLSHWYWGLEPQERPTLPSRLNFLDWQANLYGDLLESGDILIRPYLENLKNLYTVYKEQRFGIQEMIDCISNVATETDLIIIDHVHYFDLHDDNENRAMKDIVQEARNIALQIKKPIVLVGHLRKTNPQTAELVPNFEEFHGSSDLPKASTKIITLAPGGLVPKALLPDPMDLMAYTYCRAAKCRGDSFPTWHVGYLKYSMTRNEYEKGYAVGKLTNQGKSFEELSADEVPWWANKNAKSTGPRVEGVVPNIRNYAPSQRGGRV